VTTSVKPQRLRDAIASSIAGNVKSYDVAAWCVSLGLEPAREGEDPNRSKFVYVKSKLTGLELSELVRVAIRLLSEWDDSELQAIVDAFGAGGVDGQMKNLVFAAIGPKPKIVLRDAVNNDVEIVENAQYCLVYDQPLADGGLTWSTLVAWWAARLETDNVDVAAQALWKRLNQSLDEGPERVLFRTYTRRYGTDPTAAALIPQVYLHYDPYVRRPGEAGPLFRQRMDFLLLMPGRRRIVLEIDGRQHYAKPDGTADTAAYAKMVAEDRRLRLSGYEVHRFGGYEFVQTDRAVALLEAFFEDLLGR
jgi:hypothetical protein